MNRMFLVAACLALSFGSAACAADPTASDLVGMLTGDANGAAADNAHCALFTPEEIASYMGQPVDAGSNAAMGMGCQWLAETGEGDVLVTVIPAEYAERPFLAPGFRDAPEVGANGFVVPELGGWAAGVTKGADFVRVSLAGGTASEQGALALLAETLKRREE